MIFIPIKLQKLLQKRLLTLQLHYRNINMTLAIAKWCKVNEILSALCHEKNIYLIDLNEGKLNLNKNGSNILNCTFFNEISKIFN